jgi:micrococcal nuclease
MVNWDEINDAPKFSLEGQKIKAKIVSVYDGDTVKCVFPLHDKLYKWNCRLSGVDTPEIRTRNKLEKAYGYTVRNNLREKILNKVVNIECGEFDKYGRLLIKIQCDGDDCSVNQWLINKDYAFAYDGNAKKCWKEHLEEKNKA